MKYKKTNKQIVVFVGTHANRADLFFLIFKGEHNSKVVAHIGDEDFTVRINTDGEEYNIEVCLTVDSSVQTISSFSCGCFQLVTVTPL